MAPAGHPAAAEDVPGHTLGPVVRGATEEAARRTAERRVSQAAEYGDTAAVCGMREPGQSGEG